MLPPVRLVPFLVMKFLTVLGAPLNPGVPRTEQKRACITTTERKSFGELFWPQRKTFQAGRGSGESNRPLTPILLKSIAIRLPFLSRYFCKSMPSSWQKVVYTPPICITIRLPFVSRYFAEVLGSGVVGTPPSGCKKPYNKNQENHVYRRKSFLCGPHFFLQRKVLHWSRAVHGFLFPARSFPDFPEISLRTSRKLPRPLQRSALVCGKPDTLS